MIWVIEARAVGEHWKPAGYTPYEAGQRDMAEERCRNLNETDERLIYRVVEYVAKESK